MWVWVIVCLYASALWWTGNLSKVYLANANWDPTDHRSEIKLNVLVTNFPEYGTQDCCATFQPEHLPMNYVQDKKVAHLWAHKNSQ